MKTNKITWILFTSLLFFSACSGDQSDVVDINELATTASFDIAAITATKADAIGRGSNKYWAEIPSQKSVTFKLCLMDKTLQIPLQHQKLSIQSPFDTVTKETNTAGCTTFNETFDVDFFNQERLIDYPIEVTGIGGHPGKQRVRLTVNPWSENLNTLVYDQRFDDLPNLRINKDDNLQEAPLKAMNIALSFFNNGFNNDTQSAFYNFRLGHEVYSWRLDLEGNLVQRKLQSGHFQISAELIEERENNFTKISSTTLESVLKAGLIQENLEFHFPRGFQHHPDSRFYLHYTLKPIGLDIKEHTGIFPLASLNGSSEGSLTDLSEFPLELTGAPYKSEAIASKADEQESEIIVNNSGITIASVNVGEGLLLPGEHRLSTQRIRRHPVEICLVDTLSANGNRPLPNTQISLKATQNGIDDSNEERLHQTNINGCFQSYLLLSYDYLSCEKYFEMNYTISIQDGRYRDQNVHGKVAINPFNSADLFYDLNLAQTPPTSTCEAPHLMATQFSYTNEGSVRDGFYINRDLNLTLKKRYSFVFKPQFTRANAYQEIKNPENLYQGKLKIVTSLFAPKNATVDRHDFVEEEWDYLTTSEVIGEIKPDGLIQGDIDLSFHLSEILFLGFQNTLVVSVYPTEGINLKPVHFMVPFHAIVAGGNFTPRLLKLDYSEELAQKTRFTLKRDKKVPGLHTNKNFSLHDQSELSPLERYKKELERLAQKDETSLITGSYEDFNKHLPLDGKDWKGREQFKSTLTKNEFRTLATNIGDIPKSYLSRFCRLFSHVPQKNDRRTIFFGNSNDFIGGEEYQECLKNPSEHIEITPMSFVEEIIGNKLSEEHDGHQFDYYQARFIQDEEGKIRRGNAYFAAYGDRSSIDWGERQSKSIQHSYSYGLEGPSMLFIGTSESHTSAQETYQVKNTAEMRAAFNRYYTSRDLIDLTYNSVTLEFPARMKDCITIRSKTGKKNLYNYCRKDSRIKRMQETWFFIGDTNTQNHGVLSDGNIVGDSNRQQVIRGKQNFNLLWDAYETEDALLVVEELGTVTVGDAFTKYINREKGLIPFENKYDHSFPGMMIPVSHEPTRSCNGCQDP